MIILIAIPLLLRAVGIFCEKSDRRLLYCISVSLAVFTICGLPAFSGFGDGDYSLLGAVIKNIPFDNLGELSRPPAKMLLMKLCAFFGDGQAIYPLVTALMNAALAGYAVRRAPYHSSAVLCFIFIPAFFFRSGTLTAALICTIASAFVRERRFFRYAALVLMAACFDMSALLTLPFCLITLIPGAFIPAVIAAAAAALAGIFPEALDGIYEAFGGMTESCDTPVLWAVIAVIAALVSMLMYAMFKNREGGYERLVPLLCCGAAFTVTAIFDIRLYAPAIMLMMQTSVPLADEAYGIGSKFVGILFKEKDRTARTVFLAVCAVIGAVLCVCLLMTDAFGVSQYDVAVKAVFGL